MWIPDTETLAPVGAMPAELAGVGADEAASGHTVRTVDEDLVDHVAAVGKARE